MYGVGEDLKTALSRGGGKSSYGVPRLAGGPQEEKGTTEDEMAGWHH